MEFIYLGVKFITSNPWRSVSLLLVVISIGLYATMRIQSLRLREANIALQEQKAKIAKLIVDGIVQDRSIAIASNELAILRKKQIADAKRIANLLKNWPVDCDGAATAAANILRERNK